MSMDVGRTTTPFAAASGTSKSGPSVRDAAGQFEALMISQLLKSARSEGGGWFGTGDDQAGALGIDMAEQEFARMLAAGGGLGLAKLITAGLQQAASTPHPEPGAEHTPPGSVE